MTDGRKATIVLNYLEECDSTTVINLLDSLLDDEPLALLYDKLKEDGIDLPDEDEEEIND